MEGGMLSENRKRQKWSTDPHNLHWANDDDKFGSKMLKKMGWSHGKGLGRNEDGSTDNIKVKLKNNTKGLGLSLKQDNNWVAHQDDFSSLLANLNENHSNTDETTAKDKKDIKSLESKSKKQKKVHYHKFARGKDLSRYKSEDMAAIFGQKAYSAPASPQTKVEDEDDKLKKEEIVHVKSELSVQQYFAKRMKELTTKSNDGNVESEQKPKKRKAESDTDVVNKLENDEGISLKKNKKKRKKEKKSKNSD